VLVCGRDGRRQDEKTAISDGRGWRCSTWFFGYDPISIMAVSEKCFLCIGYGGEEVNVLLEVRLLNIRQHISDVLGLSDLGCTPSPPFLRQSRPSPLPTLGFRGDM
jgi:hypothetical protein